jgi:hypothetical protein
MEVDRQKKDKSPANLPQSNDKINKNNKTGSNPNSASDKKAATSTTQKTATQEIVKRYSVEESESPRKKPVTKNLLAGSIISFTKAQRKDQKSPSAMTKKQDKPKRTSFKSKLVKPY